MPRPTTRWSSPRPAKSSRAATFTARRWPSASDLLVIALAQLATISERRSERLVNPALSGLPAFLTRHGGLHSGLMIAQVTAAALTSELKTLAHPASVDTIPTSANKEDHVSMSMARGAEGGTRLAACDPRDRRRSLVCVPGDRLAGAARHHPIHCMHVHAAVREHVPTLVDDRPPAPDLDRIAEMIRPGALEYASGVVVN